MLRLLTLLVALANGLLRTRRDLILKSLALRQQLSALVLEHPRHRLGATDRMFWVLLRRFWSGWKQAMVWSSKDESRHYLPSSLQWRRNSCALGSVPFAKSFLGE